MKSSTAILIVGAAGLLATAVTYFEHRLASRGYIYIAERLSTVLKVVITAAGIGAIVWFMHRLAGLSF